MPYTESHKFERKEHKYEGKKHEQPQNKEKELLQHVLAHSEKENPKDVLSKIDSFCQKIWMMNLGDQKGQIVKETILEYKPKTILELGGYVGYSSLFMAYYSEGTVDSIEINKDYAEIASKIHEHAGIKTIKFHIGTVADQKQFLVEHGPFDMIFIDHQKKAYLPDLKLLQIYGAIGKSTIVIGDNMIYPGSPDYLDYFKQSEDYDSTLYHSNLQYSDDPDAVLVSLRITEPTF